MNTGKNATAVGLAALLLTGGGPAAAAPSTFTYHGEIKLNNTAVSGPCDFQFRLFGSATNVDQIGSAQNHFAIQVTEGRFAVPLGFGSAAFPGADRWLQIAVQCPAQPPPPPDEECPDCPTIGTTLSPRELIRSVPYAMNATRADQAATATSATWAETAISLIGYPIVSSGHIVDGTIAPIDVGFNYAGSATKGGPATDVAFNYAGSATKGGAAADVACTTGCVTSTEVDFSYAASASKGGAALDLACATGCVASAEVNFSYAGSTTKGGAASDVACTGCVETVGLVAGANAQVLRTVSGAAAWGTDGLTLPYSGTVNSSGNGFSVINSGAGPGISISSQGGIGVAGSTSGDTTKAGVFGSSSTPGGLGVYGLALGEGIGVRGISATGVMGRSSKDSATTQAGVVGEGTGSNGIGVRGVAVTGTGASGILGEAGAGVAVRAKSTSGLAVSAVTGDSNAIWATNASNGHTTIVSQNTGTGDFYRAIKDVNGAQTTLFRVTTSGRVVTSAVQITGGGDLAELFDVRGDNRVEPGTVLVIDEENPGGLKPSDQPYDSGVAGVVSGAGGVNPGMVLHQEGVLEGDVTVALAGRVYVKADARSGPIRPRDLLTTSALAGHAMRAGEREGPRGAIIGKALTGLEDGTGLVLVLLSPQ